MTLGRLLELLEAEKQGHQVIRRTILKWRDYGDYEEEVKICECDLSEFVNPEDDDIWVLFYIKGIEDECGNKLKQTE